MSKKHAIFKHSPKLEFLSNFKVFLNGLAGKGLVYKTAISDFQNIGFAKEYFSKTNFFRKLIFSFSKIFQKPEYMC